MIQTDVLILKYSEIKIIWPQKRAVFVCKRNALRHKALRRMKAICAMFLSQLGQKSHYFNKKTGWFQGLKQPVFDAKVAELFRNSCPFGHKCKYCLPKHGHTWLIIFYFVRKSVQKRNDTLACKRANYKARQHTPRTRRAAPQ